MTELTVRPDAEEIEITRTEKLLAVVLAAFFLIGGVWGYAKLDDVARAAQRPPDSYYTASERAAVDRASTAGRRLGAAETAGQEALAQLELEREAYRTSLDAGRPSTELEKSYETAQRVLEAAEVEVRAARTDAAAAQPAADAAYRRAGEAASEAARERELVGFLLRLALVLLSLAAGYWLIVRLEHSGSRYLPVAFSLVGASAVLALVLAGDYVTDYVDVSELGPLVLSLAGIVLTLAAFWWVQRLIVRRVPLRRVRRGDCPSCGYPLRGLGDAHCEGCGRPTVAECGSCQRPRRVGTTHCGACGAA